MRMKRSAILVNTARGPVIDEEALAWALKERLIAAAALDVYEREPVVQEALLTMENVVLAPHLGSATRETRTAMIDLAVSNVIEVLAGASAADAGSTGSRRQELNRRSESEEIKQVPLVGNESSVISCTLLISS